MSEIRLLDNEICDLIAAGEVVERPASVVKELVENSIDADSSIISIDISKGGLGKIRVADKGCGMSPADAERSFLKHATSKISKKDDLISIKTLGFRGEAIPSVAAVSKVKLITKEKDAVSGYEIINEGGVILEKREIGAPDGTVFEVSELFYNTPARLKFMKSEAAETGIIHSLIEKLALSHPDISFSFSVNGTEKLFTPGNGKLTDVIYSVFGKDFAARMLPVKYLNGAIEILGYTGNPLLNKPNRNYQVFFVNNRLIKSKVLQQSLEMSYRNAMLVGRYPCCVIFIKLPFEDVDINVHPNKTEIKFSDDPFISNNLNKAIYAALRGDSGVFDVSLQTDDTEVPEEKIEQITRIAVENESKTKPAIDNAGENSGTEKNKLASVSIVSFGKWAITAETGNPVAYAEEEVLKPIDEDMKNEPVCSLASEKPTVSDIYLYKTKNEEEPSVKKEEEKPPEKESEPLKITSENEGIAFRIVGEVFKTYIVIEKDKEMLLIDKHALHERMIFEKLKSAEKISSQLLLTPFLCNLGEEDNSVIAAHRGELEALGFDAEDFGSGILIREIPEIIETKDVEYILGKAAETLKSKNIVTTEVFDELLYIVACKAAIKSGFNTTEQELKALTDEYFRNKEKLKYCPHGRPITISFSEYFIEKQFKRIV